MTPLPEKLPGEGLLKKDLDDRGQRARRSPDAVADETRWQYRLAPILSAGSSKRPRVTTMW